MSAYGFYKPLELLPGDSLNLHTLKSKYNRLAFRFNRDWPKLNEFERLETTAQLKELEDQMKGLK